MDDQRRMMDDTVPNHDASLTVSAQCSTPSRSCPGPDDDKDANFGLRHIHALGFRSCGRTYLDFLSETQVIYPVAHHLSIFHLENHTMEFLHHTKSVQSIQCFHVSLNRELIAVAEVHHNATTSTASTLTTPINSSIKPTKIALTAHLHDHQQHVLSIYKTSTRSRVRTIALAHNACLVSCCFSSDNKFLVMLEDAPTHNVTLWKVSSAKLVATGKCPSRGSRVCIHPHNSNFISVSGPMVLKYWVWTNNDFKIGNFLPQLREQEHFVDHVWMKEYMVAVSERGMLLCFRSAVDYTRVDLVHSSRCHQPSFVRMECITVHAKGFVLGGSAGFFSIYEASDDPKDPFAFVRSVCVGDVAFECITVSPNVETIVACTKSRELLTFSMSAIDTLQEDRVAYQEFIRHGHQLGAVLQVDICVQRPIVITCGTDKTVRVWNFDLRQYELLQQFPEEPCALTVHPSGFQLLVAFKERVRMYQILQENLRQTRDFALKSCRAVKFSHGGHLFACAAGLTITTFHTYTLEVVHTFSGHIGAVRCLTWTRDDVFLFSAAHDGAIYRWNMNTGTRSEEMQHVVKQCQYVALVVDPRDPNVIVAAGSDGKLREITAGEETKSVDLMPGIYVTSMVLMTDSKRVFAGTNVGSILMFTWPLSSKSVWEYFAHGEPITHMCITPANDQLISSSEDGSVCVFKILNNNNSSSGSLSLQPEQYTLDDHDKFIYSDLAKLHAYEKKKQPTTFTDAILIAREDLDERQAALVELQQRYEQLQADVEFALHRKENEWIDRLRVVKEESESLVVQERIRYEELEARHQLAARKHAEELSQMEANHVKLTQEMENQYERMLAQEIARYDALSETLEQTRQQCEALVETQDNQNRRTLHTERKAAYARTKEQNEIIKRLHDDLKYNHVKFEEVLHQEETEYEQELQKLRADYEQQLEVERQNTALKQGQLSAANTKLESLKKKMQEFKTASHARDILLSTERAKITKLEATLENYEKHFETCKFAITDKEKTIIELKSSNRILENFRSVLHHRIDCLEVEKTPMQTHMDMLETQVGEMQNELVGEYKTKAEIQQEIETKDAKLKTLHQEVKMLRQSSLKKEYTMSEMRREFARIAQSTNWKDMEAAVKDAYKIFVIGETVHRKPPKPLLTPAVSSPNQQTEQSKRAKQQTGSGSVPGSPSSSVASPVLRSGGGVANKTNGFGRVSTAPSPTRSKINRSDPQLQQMEELSSDNISSEALGYDCKQAVDESVKQMEYMSRTITMLRTSLENANTKADRIRRDSVAEGSILIEECNKLRKENKQLMIKTQALEQIIYSAGLHSASNDALSPHQQLATPKRTLMKQTSASCPQINSSANSPSNPESELILDTNGINSAFKLQPLQGNNSNVTPSKQRRQFIPGSPSTSSKHGDTGNNMLPFARLERVKQMQNRRTTNREELATVVDNQQREIQRLQHQVQLLLSNDVDSKPDNVIRATPSVDLSMEQGRTASLSSSSTRVGVLRPIMPSYPPSPLHSSFVLTPIDATDTDR